MAFVRSGDTFMFSDGVRVVVVDKQQAKQTAGYWVHALTQADVGDICRDNTSTLVLWPMLASSGRSRWLGGGLLSLCREDELDERENEFGVISP